LVDITTRQQEMYFRETVRPLPDKRESSALFGRKRLRFPAGVDKKLNSWALNANIVKPASLVACLSRLSLSGYSIVLTNQGNSGFSFDFSMKVDVWLTWDGRENPAAEPKPMAALVSRQEFRDRAGLQWSCCRNFHVLRLFLSFS